MQRAVGAGAGIAAALAVGGLGSAVVGIAGIAWFRRHRAVADLPAGVPIVVVARRQPAP